MFWLASQTSMLDSLRVHSQFVLGGDGKVGETNLNYDTRQIYARNKLQQGKQA